MSPAEVAGLRPTRRDEYGRIFLGDAIVAVDGQPVRSGDDLVVVTPRKLRDATEVDVDAICDGTDVVVAGVLDDALLSQQSMERFRTTLAPKAFGACHLDRLTRDYELDFFLVSSSVSSQACARLGSPCARAASASSNCSAREFGNVRVAWNSRG